MQFFKEKAYLHSAIKVTLAHDPKIRTNVPVLQVA